jgi:hypothetical protein
MRGHAVDAAVPDCVPPVSVGYPANFSAIDDRASSGNSTVAGMPSSRANHAVAIPRLPLLAV